MFLIDKRIHIQTSVGGLQAAFLTVNLTEFFHMTKKHEDKKCHPQINLLICRDFESYQIPDNRMLFIKFLLRHRKLLSMSVFRYHNDASYQKIDFFL